MPMENTTLKNPRNKSKAHIRFELRAGKQVAVKDYSSRRGVIKLYGRFTLTNEARAYARLSGAPGIPACYGFKSRDILEIESIPSRPLSSFKPGAVPAEVFKKLEQVLAVMHSRGVANGDVHRSNVLVTDSGEVYLVDFAHSFVARNPKKPGLLTRRIMELDLHALARIRARYLRLPEPYPQGVFGFLYLALSSLKKGFKRLKKVLFI
ncbi:MAG: hypothetical protein WCQ99_16240 [Pseudomonadota bacterium]